MKVSIDEWSIVSPGWYGIQRFPTKEEFQREIMGNCLVGKVTGHPNIEDGHRACTSKVVKLGFLDNTFRSFFAETQSGTIYILGILLQEYRGWLLQEDVPL